MATEPRDAVGVGADRVHVVITTTDEDPAERRCGISLGAPDDSRE